MQQHRHSLTQPNPAKQASIQRGFGTNFQGELPPDFDAIWLHFGTILSPIWAPFSLRFSQILLQFRRSISTRFWCHFGSILAPFWGPFGAPFWLILGSKTSSQNDIVFCVPYLSFRVSVRVPQGLKKSTKNPPKFLLKNGMIFWGFWGSVFEALGGGFTLQKTIKFSMIFQCDFGALLGSMAGARRGPKWYYFWVYFLD